MKISDFDKDFQEKYRYNRPDKFANLKSWTKYAIGAAGVIGFILYRKMTQLPIEQQCKKYEAECLKVQENSFKINVDMILDQTKKCNQFKDKEACKYLETMYKQGGPLDTFNQCIIKDSIRCTFLKFPRLEESSLKK